MTVELINWMGDDLTVVNAARVSFGKKHSEMTKGDVGLIKFLGKHGHWTPFGHCSLSFHIKAPIFIARQLVKHTVGLCWNEISRRYVEDEPETYHPDSWRGNPEDKKQGSDPDSNIEWIDREMRVGTAVRKVTKQATETYKKLLEAGVCAEQARMILPQNTYTEWYWTGSLYAFSRVCNLRCKGDTQKETRDVAWEIHDLAKEKFPVSWPSLFNIDK